MACVTWHSEQAAASAASMADMVSCCPAAPCAACHHPTCMPRTSQEECERQNRDKHALTAHTLPSSWCPPCARGTAQYSGHTPSAPSVTTGKQALSMQCTPNPPFHHTHLLTNGRNQGTGGSSSLHPDAWKSTSCSLACGTLVAMTCPHTPAPRLARCVSTSVH